MLGQLWNITNTATKTLLNKLENTVNHWAGIDIEKKQLKARLFAAIEQYNSGQSPELLERFLTGPDFHLLTQLDADWVLRSTLPYLQSRQQDQALLERLLTDGRFQNSLRRLSANNLNTIAGQLLNAPNVLESRINLLINTDLLENPLFSDTVSIVTGSTSMPFGFPGSTKKSRPNSPTAFAMSFKAFTNPAIFNRFCQFARFSVIMETLTAQQLADVFAFAHPDVTKQLLTLESVQSTLYNASGEIVRELLNIAAVKENVLELNPNARSFEEPSSPIIYSRMDQSTLGTDTATLQQGLDRQNEEMSASSSPASPSACSLKH